MNCFIVLARPAPKSSHNPAGGESGTATFCLGRSRWSLGGRTSIAGRGCPLCSGHLRAAAIGTFETQEEAEYFMSLAANLRRFRQCDLAVTKAVTRRAGKCVPMPH